MPWAPERELPEARKHVSPPHRSLAFPWRLRPMTKLQRVASARSERRVPAILASALWPARPGPVRTVVPIFCAVRDTLGFSGTAWIYRDRTKTSVHAERVWSTAPDGARRWWGTYNTHDGAAVEAGAAYMRFSDGADAEVTLSPGEGSRGSFEVIGELGTLEPDMTRFQGTRREASAQSPARDWPRPAGTC
jgi:hypothetical protein